MRFARNVIFYMFELEGYKNHADCTVYSICFLSFKNRLFLCLIHACHSQLTLLTFLSLSVMFLLLIIKYLNWLRQVFCDN